MAHHRVGRRENKVSPDSDKIDISKAIFCLPINYGIDELTKDLFGKMVRI